MKKQEVLFKMKLSKVNSMENIPNFLDLMKSKWYWPRITEFFYCSCRSSFQHMKFSKELYGMIDNDARGYIFSSSSQLYDTPNKLFDL
jgi:hypothetical protein